jgi:hypothetical protein
LDFWSNHLQRWRLTRIWAVPSRRLGTSDDLVPRLRAAARAVMGTPGLLGRAGSGRERDNRRGWRPTCRALGHVQSPGERIRRPACSGALPCHSARRARAIVRRSGMMITLPEGPGRQPARQGVPAGMDRAATQRGCSRHTDQGSTGCTLASSLTLSRSSAGQLAQRTLEAR